MDWTVTPRILAFHTAVGRVETGQPSNPMTVPAPIEVRDRQWCVILAGKMPNSVTISRNILPFSWRDTPTPPPW